MCQFFSCISDGKGRIYYFDAKQREQIRANALEDTRGHKNLEPDSHTSIAAFYGLNEDKCNKYEYRPLDKQFQIDQLNTTDDSKKIRQACSKIDYSGLIPELIIKPIVHPWKIKRRKRVAPADMALLKKWASVWASVRVCVRASVRVCVRESVRASVRASVRESVRDSVGDSVGASVRESVWDSVWESVGYSVWASARDSVGDSAWAYTSSFFNISKWKYIRHKKGENPFQPCIDLWHRGLVPSFDSKVWRLHGPKGKILKEISKKELRELAG
jgi:hypothetical protein